MPPLTSWLRQLASTFRIALRSIRRNKLRSGLTSLGIIIGVSAVIAMNAVGTGAQVSITGSISALGENLLTIFAGAVNFGGVTSGSVNTLTIDDIEAMVREIGDVRAASPEVSVPAQAVANGRNWATSVVGVSPEFLQIRDWKLTSGRMLEDREVVSVARVVVIGSRAALELFGPLDPVGQMVRVRDVPFEIIGRLESKGAGFGGQNQDDRILIPYTTAMKRLTGERFVRSINLEVGSTARMDAARQQIVALLRQRHQLANDQKDDFSIFSQKDIVDTVATVTGAIRLLLAAIASLSLVVGGIGIMNIMLVSVTERTREIGLRIAVGAQPGAIRLQFLIEAITLSLLGGVIGVVLGVAISKAVALVSSFTPVVTLGAVVMAFGVSFLIGVVFGYFPARRAAALNPIDALRFE